MISNGKLVICGPSVAEEQILEVQRLGSLEMVILTMISTCVFSLMLVLTCLLLGVRPSGTGLISVEYTFEWRNCSFCWFSMEGDEVHWMLLS
jgi:hypothetical protein